MRRIGTSMSFWVIGCALAGCTVGPDFRPPDATVPAAFAAPTIGADKTAEPAPSPVDLARWWEIFHDPELSALVERTVTANPDIDIALARLQEARTAESVVIGESLPDVEVSGSIARGTGSDLTRGRLAPTLTSADNGAGLTKITQAIGFDAGWEVDVFGKLRREEEAVGDDTKAAIAARSSVIVTVVADVARAYLDLRGLQSRLDVAERSAATEQKTVDLVQTRYDLGLTNALDVTLAKRELATLESRIAPLRADIKAAEFSIAVLLGDDPQALVPELEKAVALPALPASIDAGLPLDLLRRRPDIVEAEWKLAGATARIGVATANLFPSLAVTGGVGLQGGQAASSAAAKSFIWSAGPSVSWSVLDFGTLDALVEIADFRTHELLTDYKRTVLDAVAQVDAAIKNYAALRDNLRNLNIALGAGHDAVRLASERYDRGLTDFLNVLDAEREEFDLEDQYAASREAAADNLVALYKALGGGWEDHQQVPPIRQPQPAILAAIRTATSSSENLAQ